MISLNFLTILLLIYFFLIKVQKNCDDTKVADEAYFAALMIGAMRLIASLLSSKLLYHYRRRAMYFFSAILTIISVLTFATCNYFLSNGILLSNYWENIIQWMSLISAGSLVFAVQLGVQTLPLLLSGELFPSDVRPMCKGIARCIQCILLVICLKVCILEVYEYYLFSMPFSFTR